MFTTVVKQIAVALQVLVFAATCGAEPGAAVNVFQAPNRRDAVAKAAKHVAKELELAGERSIHVRAFHVQGGSDRAIAQQFNAALQELGVAADQGAKNDLSGIFVSDHSHPSVLVADCQLRIGSATPQTFQLRVNSPEEVALVVRQGGEIAAAPSKPDGAKPDTSGMAAHQRSWIRPAATSPYRVEICRVGQVGSEPQPIIPTFQNGLPRVRVRRGDRIAVRVHNDCDFEAAAEVLLDGISRFSLADNPADRTGLFDLIPKNSQRTVIGFYRDEKQAWPFVIGEQQDIPKELLLPPAVEEGVITVAFRAAWPEDQKTPPPNEPFDFVKGRIVPGKPESDPTKNVVRQIGKLRATVKILYSDAAE